MQKAGGTTNRTEEGQDMLVDKQDALACLQLQIITETLTNYHKFPETRTEEATEKYVTVCVCVCE